MGLLSEKNYRTATIITKENCEFAVLHRNDFLESIGKVFQLLMKGTKYIAEISQKINFLTDVIFFKKWNQREVKTISYQFQSVNYTLHQMVYS
jgi:hypothetical protein